MEKLCFDRFVFLFSHSNKVLYTDCFWIFSKFKCLTSYPWSYLRRFGNTFLKCHKVLYTSVLRLSPQGGKKRIEHKIKLSKREISPTNSCFLGVGSKSPARGSRESWVRDIAPPYMNSRNPKRMASCIFIPLYI